MWHKLPGISLLTDMEKEVSCRVTQALIKYLENHSIDTAGLCDGLVYNLPYLTTPINWIPADVRDTLAERAVALTRQPDIMFQIGLSVLNHSSVNDYKRILCLLMSPAAAFKNIQHTIREYDHELKFHMEKIENNRALMIVSKKSPGKISRFAIDYAQGFLSAIPTLWGLPEAEINLQSEQRPASVISAPDQPNIKQSYLFDIRWQSPKSTLYQFSNSLLKHFYKTDNIIATINKSYQELDRKNAELELRNQWLTKVREIALSMNKAVTIDEIFKQVTELTRDISGVRFVLVEKYDKVNDTIVTSHYSQPRNIALKSILQTIGFDFEKAFGINSDKGFFNLPMKKWPFVVDFMKNPQYLEITSLSQMMNGLIPRNICDSIQTVLHVQKIVILPILLENLSWGSLVLFLEEEVARDILEMVQMHCTLGLKNVIARQSLEMRNRELEATQSRLNDSEQRLHLTVDALFEGVILLSMNGKIMQANEGASKLYGYHHDQEFIGKYGLRYVIWNDRRKIRSDLKYVLETGSNRINEYNVVRKDRTHFICEMNIGLNKNSQGLPLGYIFCIRDVSRKKEDELKLANSERKFRLIAENTNELISMINLYGYFTYLNPTYKLLGLDPDKLVNTFVMDIIHPDDRSRFMPTLLKFSQMDDDDLSRLHKENFSQRLEYRLKDESGHWHDFEITGTITEALDGVGYNLLLMSRDITARKKIEMQLNEAYQKEKQAHRALELEINRRAEFFRALVHELKTPLTPILVSSETLVELQENPSFKNLARNVYNGATRLNRRVDELMDIARGELGLLKIKAEPLNIAVLIEDVAQFILPQVQQSRQNLTIDLPANLPLVMGDETRLRQVLLNLLENAIKFTPENGKIQVKALADEKDLLIVVQDNGQGIAKDEQERLFQPYNRIESDRQHFSGLGLGLALCKQLVELHGGKIKIASKKGEGTAFYITLAVMKNQETPDKPPAQVHKIPSENR